MIDRPVNVQSVLVEHSYGGKVFANSGCLVDNKFVLITSNALVPLLNGTKVPLRSAEVGLSSPSKFFDAAPKITVVIRNEESSNHTYKRAVIVAAYVSETIRKSVVKYLYDWTIDAEGRGVQLKEALSVFFIAQIDLKGAPEIDDLRGCVKRLKSQSSRANLTAGTKICVEGTPFGNRHFLKCHSRGIVANVLGEKNCFILTDVSTAPGSEGSPVFARYRNDEIPVGIVLSCMSWWKGEWIGLTLSASFETIFDEILGNDEVSSFTKSDTLRTAKPRTTIVLDVLQKSVAQVTSGTFWGTAILLDRGKGIFITNSHVIETENPVLHWNDTNITSRVLYKSPDNQIFDVAILSVDRTDLQRTAMMSVKLSPNPPNIGDRAYALGFPLFPRPTKPKPTMTAGHVSHISKTMLKTSCSVLPGASGGGILKKDGTLIGLIVCNAKMEENSTTYPRVNMAVPIAAIYDVLVEFCTSGDTEVLEKLRIENISAIREWNFVKAKM